MRLGFLATAIVFLLSALISSVHAVEAQKQHVEAASSDVVAVNTDSAEQKNRPDIELTEEEIILALKEVLDIGIKNAASKLSVKDGYYKNPEVHISIPESMTHVIKVIRKLGNEKSIDTMELRLNRAAEDVTPKVAGYFILGVKQLTIKEPRKILAGKSNAATQYLSQRMEIGLAKVIRPVVKKELIRSGAYSAYEDVMDQYRRIPFEPSVRGSNIEDHMVDRIMEAMFLHLVKAEALVRADPTERPTELLQKVFAGP